MRNQPPSRWTEESVAEAHRHAGHCLSVSHDLGQTLQTLERISAAGKEDDSLPAALLLENEVLRCSFLSRLERYEEARMGFEAIFPLPPDTPQAPRMRALNAYAITLRWLGDTQRAYALFEELRELTQRHEEPVFEIRVLTNQANMLYAGGDHLAATPLRLRALELSRHVGDLPLHARMALNLGFEQIEQGDDEGAADSLKEAERIEAEIDDPVIRGRLQSLRAHLALRAEHFAAVLEAVEIGLVAMAADATGLIGGQLCLQAAEAHFGLGNFAEAATFAARAVTALQEGAPRKAWLEARYWAARAAFAGGNTEGARQLAAALVDDLVDFDDCELRSHFEGLRAELAEQAGDLDAAIFHLRAGAKLRQTAVEERNRLQSDLMRARLDAHALRLREEAMRRRSTELNRLNTELTAKNEALERLHQEKNDLLTIIAHDLRNQLGAAVNFGEVSLLRSDLAEAEWRDTVQTIYGINRSTLELLEHLLSLERVEHGGVLSYPSVFPLKSWLKDLVARLENLGRLKNIDVLPSVSPPEVEVEMDETWLRLIIENFLSNAFKYSPHGSRIELRAVCAEGRLRCEILDSGPGVPKNEIPSLFSKFHLAGSIPTGNEFSTGLGLYLVKKYADLLGAEVGYTPRPGGGSVFWLDSPEG